MSNPFGEAAAILMKEYKDLSKEKWCRLELCDDNIFRWTIGLVVTNPDSAYHGGYFKCTMQFPRSYPYSPPDFRFSNPLWHPNIYPDGKVCISILHAPGDDAMSGEAAGERWSPAQRVESVLISILSLLEAPEVSSPANVDASVQYRDDIAAFRLRVRQDVEKSKKEIPEDFVIPAADAMGVKKQEVEDESFWDDSDADNDFDDFDEDEMENGSDTDDPDAMSGVR